MRTYHIFKINNNISKLYYNRGYYLYKMFEEIFLSSISDLEKNINVYKKLVLSYNVKKINSILYRNNLKEENYNKELNSHKINKTEERSKLLIHDSFIKIKSNINFPLFFNDLKKEKNLFVCDFINRDYFWLDKLETKSLV